MMKKLPHTQCMRCAYYIVGISNCFFCFFFFILKLRCVKLNHNIIDPVWKLLMPLTLTLILFFKTYSKLY